MRAEVGWSSRSMRHGIFCPACSQTKETRFLTNDGWAHTAGRHCFRCDTAIVNQLLTLLADELKKLGTILWLIRCGHSGSMRRGQNDPRRHQNNRIGSTKAARQVAAALTDCDYDCSAAETCGCRRAFHPQYICT